MVKIVLLDVDDTLLDFYKCSLVSLQEAFRACQLEFKEEYYPTFKKINDNLWHQLERKEISEEQLFSTRFQLIFDALGLQGDSQRARIVFKEQLDNSHEVIPYAKELLDYLSSKNYIDEFEYLYKEILRDTKIKIKPLVKKSFVDLLKEVFKH